MLEEPCNGLALQLGAVEILLLVASCYGDRISSAQMGHLARMQTLPLPMNQLLSQSITYSEPISYRVRSEQISTA